MRDVPSCCDGAAAWPWPTLATPVPIFQLNIGRVQRGRRSPGRGNDSDDEPRGGHEHRLREEDVGDRGVNDGQARGGLPVARPVGRDDSRKTIARDET